MSVYYPNQQLIATAQFTDRNGKPTTVSGNVTFIFWSPAGGSGVIQGYTSSSGMAVGAATGMYSFPMTTPAYNAAYVGTWTIKVIADTVDGISSIVLNLASFSYQNTPGSTALTNNDYSSIAGFVWSQATSTNLGVTVWTYTTRELSTSFGLSNFQYSSIAGYVWQNANNIYSSIAGMVWTQVTRTLTSSPLTDSDYSTIAGYVWNYATRTLTANYNLSDAVYSSIAGFMWSQATSTNLGQTVWTYTGRVCGINVESASTIAGFVWNYATRELTTNYNLSNSVYSSIAGFMARSIVADYKGVAGSFAYQMNHCYCSAFGNMEQTTIGGNYVIYAFDTDGVTLLKTATITAATKVVV